MGAVSFSSKPSPKPSKNDIIIIVGCILAVLFIICSAFYVLGGCKKTQTDYEDQHRPQISQENFTTNPTLNKEKLLSEVHHSNENLTT